MLVNNTCSKPWMYMEVPRTASTTIEKCLRAVYPASFALYQKHWPISTPEVRFANWRITSVRNPFSRAVSCWQFFTVPGKISFEDWLLQVKKEGFIEHNIEAMPQAFWLSLNRWESWIRFEFLKTDLESLFTTLGAVNQTVTQAIPHHNAIGGPWFNRRGKSTVGLRSKPWHAFYSENTIQLVRDVYAVDFEKMRCTYSDKIEDAIRDDN
jgi:hypothetical protein